MKGPARSLAEGLRRLLGWLDDALNPIVVKELRQAVHGRFLAGILLFFLVLQLATLGIYLLSKGLSSIDLVGGESYGAEVFGVLVGILFFAIVFCVPIYAAVRMVSERSGDAMALFFVTTLAPHRIVAGKLASNLVLVLLLASACLPYLSFTYFLRGIDLPTVLVALAVGLLASVTGIQVALFLASLPVSRVLQVLIGLAGLGWLLFLFTTSLSFAGMLPHVGIGSRLGSWQFWGPALVTLVGVGLLLGLLFTLSAAVITHAAANRARPVRLYAMAAWGTSAAGAAYAGLVHGGHQVVGIWLYVAMLLLAASFLPAVCGRDRLSRRLAGEVPRSGPRRLAAFFLFSGSANGLAWAVVMIVLTFAVGVALNHRLGGPLRSLPQQLLGLAAYVLAYALVAVLVQRHLIGRWLRREQTWVLTLVLIAAASLVPPIAAFLLAPDALGRSLDFGFWLIMNPFSPFRPQLEDFAVGFALVLAALTAVFANRWFIDQVQAFRPPPAPEAELAGSAGLER